MPKVTKEQYSAKREEIIEACIKLYETTSFKDLTIKDIATLTSFSRPSIYNYFQTKEEIFLAIIEREYDLWNADLEAILNENETLTSSDFASKVATSLSKRGLLLKIMAMNHYDMEENSRLEKLCEFKVSYAASLKLFSKCLNKFFPSMSDKQIQDVVYIFFPFMFGIYPYCFVSDKQHEAMEQAAAKYVFMSPYEIIYSCLNTLLSRKESNDL